MRARDLKGGGRVAPPSLSPRVSLGNFELALRGQLGDGAPLSPASLLRLKTQGQGGDETWKQRRLDDLKGHCQLGGLQCWCLV
jgi:hypothetical protein